MFGSKFHPLRIMSGAAGLDIYNGGGGGKGGGDAPSAPDYKAAAEATAAGNLELAKYTTEANRINQVTPYGNITYSTTPYVDQAGYDAALKQYNTDLATYNANHPNASKYSWFANSKFGSKFGQPTAPLLSDYTHGQQWTATQTLSPEQQKILEQTQGLSQSKLGYAQDIMSKAAKGQGGVDMSGLPSYGINPGETYSDAIMRRLQPQLQAQQESFDAKMANQGVMPGTAAYDAAYRNFSQAQNDQLTSAITGGMGVGLQANQQAYQQALQNLNQPINMVNALQTGAQVQNPQGVNSYNMPQVQGTDYLGAAQNKYSADVANYNAEQQAGSNFLGGLVGIGNLGYNIYKMSDINTKENIKEIGKLDNGIKIYAFDYKPEFKDLAGYGRFIGVMAQEVEKVIPEAVVTTSNGYKAVNYAMLGV